MFKNYRKKITKKNIWPIFLFGVIFASLVLKSININYNSAFNDEAIYIVVGNLGLFKSDWISMTPFSWMGGVPYLYPVMAAFFYLIGGLALLRFVNVVLFSITSYLIYKIAFLLSSGKQIQKQLAGLLATTIFAGSALGYLVSRLATYDMVSFMFLTLGIYQLVCAEKKRRVPGNLYLLSAISLSLAFLFKYSVVVFFPILFLITFFFIKKSNKKRIVQFIYFCLPIAISIGGFAILQSSNIKAFLNDQVAGDVKSSISEVMDVFVREINIVFTLLGIGSLGFLVNKRYKELFAYLLVSVTLFAVHLVALRTHTLDKHLLTAVAGFSIISGTGIVSVGNFVKNKVANRVYVTGVVVLLISLWFYSFVSATKYNSQWENTDAVLAFSEKNVESEDIVLSELGAVTQLELYDRNGPLNIYTFDWIYYNGDTGKEAIWNGVSDGYFDLIILETQINGKLDSGYDLHSNVSENDDFDYLYTKIYADANFDVYKRNY